MHIVQATYNFNSAEAAQEAITGIWERGGYVRPNKDHDTAIDVVAPADQAAAIRAFAMPTAGAPEAAPLTTGEGTEGSGEGSGEGSEGNADVVPPIEGAEVIK